MPLLVSDLQAGIGVEQAVRSKRPHPQGCGLAVLGFQAHRSQSTHRSSDGIPAGSNSTCLTRIHTRTAVLLPKTPASLTSHLDIPPSSQVSTPSPVQATSVKGIFTALTLEAFQAQPGAATTVLALTWMPICPRPRQLRGRGIHSAARPIQGRPAPHRGGGRGFHLRQESYRQHPGTQHTDPGGARGWQHTQPAVPRLPGVQRHNHPLFLFKEKLQNLHELVCCSRSTTRNPGG